MSSLLEEARRIAKVSVGEDHGGYLQGVHLVGASGGAAKPSARPPVKAANPPAKAVGAMKSLSGRSGDVGRLRQTKVPLRRPSAAALKGKSPHKAVLVRSAVSIKKSLDAGNRALKVGSAHKSAATRVTGACVLGAEALGHEVVVGGTSPMYRVDGARLVVLLWKVGATWRRQNVTRGVVTFKGIGSESSSDGDLRLFVAAPHGSYQVAVDGLLVRQPVTLLQVHGGTVTPVFDPQMATIRVRGDEWEIENVDRDIRGDEWEIENVDVHAPDVVGAPAPPFRKPKIDLAHLTAAAKAKLTPKQRAAVRKHEAAIAKANAAAVAAVKKGNAAVSSSKTLSDHMKKVSPALLKVINRGRTVVHGEVVGFYDIAGFYDIVGVDANGRSPGDPGYDDTTDPNSWNYQGGGAAPNADSGGDPAVPAVYTMENDPNVTPMPVRGQPLSQDEAQAVFQRVPEDAIVLPESLLPLAPNTVGSWNYFYATGDVKAEDGGKTPGVLWTQGPLTNRWVLTTQGQGKDGRGRGNLWVADRMRTDNELAWYVMGHQLPPHPPGETGYLDPSDIPVTNYRLSAVPGADPSDYGAYMWSMGAGDGPIIGNPKKDRAGLQYASADRVFFWQGKNAPKWVTAEADNAIATANQKILDADNKAAQAEAAARAKEIADAEAEKARVEAENALAEETAESKGRVSDAEAGIALQKQYTDDVATQSALDAAQFRLEQEAQQLQLQAQRQQLQWLAQNGLPPDAPQDGAEDGAQVSDVNEYGVPMPPKLLDESDGIFPEASVLEVPDLPEGPLLDDSAVPIVDENVYNDAAMAAQTENA